MGLGALALGSLLGCGTKSSSNDIVFDPFLGSGTTAQVAQALGRQWIGCELNPEYVSLQNERTRQNGLVFDKEEVTA